MKAPLEDIPISGEAYSNFADSIRTRATLRTYAFNLAKYTAWRNMPDYDSLIAEDRTTAKLTEARIKDFILSLRQRNLSQGYIRGYLKALKHFYSMNDVLINWKKVSRFAIVMEGEGEQVRRRDRAYTHEEIGNMLRFASLKMQAVILLLASTGMRLGAFPDLQLRNIMMLKEHDIYQITVYEGSKEEYITFCTPEAAKTLNKYLDLRQYAGETYADASPVFRTDFDPEDQFQARYSITPLSSAAINGSLQTILDHAGISRRHTLIEGETGGRIRKDVQRHHGFRKFTNTQMVQADLKGAAKEMLLGHSIGLDDKYYRPTPQQLLDEYLRAVDLLTINEENRLRKKVEELTVRTDQMQQLKNEIDELRSLYESRHHQRADIIVQNSEAVQR